MRVSPRRSVLASIGAGCCLAASVIAGGYAASGAMPFSDWPGAIFSSKGAAVVALAPATRAAAPVLTLPASTAKAQTKTEVIPLDEAPAASTQPAPAASAPATTKRTATTLPETRKRAPKTDDADTRPATTPTTATPAPAAAAPVADPTPTQAAAPVAQAATRKVKLGSVTSTFSGAHDSSSGQPELRVQMAVADASETTGTRTVALSLKLAPTDVASLVRSAQAINASNIALETQVDVVDATVASAGQPACADGQCLRVQMKFAPDTRVNPVEGPEVQVLDDGDAISNRVRVVVKIDTADLGTTPTTPTADPAPQDGEPRVLSLPLPPATDPASPPAPTTDTATVALPGDDPATGTPDAPAVQIQAQLEVVDTPAPEAPAPDPAAAPAPTPTPAPDPATGTTATTAPAADAPAATTPVAAPAAAKSDCK
jgi:hypothetical protein